ncbi:MAG: flagellar biosynthesis protein FlhB [Oscillospiraceae bacterium]|nr:flagellar biosynthesis protein FlhB [Oscillospiraceae bacterium]MCI8714354.1 flagellar biosynthesis protein FlhB [Oscillospiraceae bacterium]MCI9317071.1 flagellar biosynthesis protein FlhB [Oscillospiraceae bacterium]
MAGDKTEKATPKKRRDERKKGNVMMSKDVVAVATLLGSLAMLRIMGDTVVEQAKNLFASSFSLIAESGAAAAGQSLRELFTRCILVFVTVAGPFLAVTALLAVAATFAQTRMLVTGESLKPKFNRISPLQGFKRLFSMRSVVETLKSLLKIVVLLYLIFSYFGDTAVGFSRFFDMELGQACSILFNDILALVLRVAVAFVVLAGADFFYQWWDYERQMRMSKQEIKEEYKQTEGDPQVKGKIKEIQRRRAQQRMMQQVPGADVVIRNPTHVAVALRYKPEKDDAPVVVAKGLDELALRIVAVAEENRVAIVENVPLARSLFAGTDLDREIPPEFYGPVAEILVYVLKLDQKEA